MAKSKCSEGTSSEESNRIKVGSVSQYLNIAILLSIWIFSIFVTVTIVGRYGLDREFAIGLLLSMIFIYGFPFVQAVLNLRSEMLLFAISTDSLLLKNGKSKKFESALCFEVLEFPFLVPRIRFEDYKFAPSPLLVAKNPQIQKVILDWIETSPERDKIVKQIDESLKRQFRKSHIFAGCIALIAGVAGFYLSGPILALFLFTAPLIVPITRLKKPFLGFEKRIPSYRLKLSKI